MFARTWSREAAHDVRGVFGLLQLYSVLSSPWIIACLENPLRTRLMPPKRKRIALVATNGFVKPKSVTLPNGLLSSRWGWVSSEVLDVDNITLEHRMVAANLSTRNGNPLCQNKYAIGSQEIPVPEAIAPSAPSVNGELSEDIIVVSDADEPLCAKRACKTNPFCLNYLGQEMWENEGKSHP
jgi:ubiquitin carboxyl-terminal hydrolase 48